MTASKMTASKPRKRPATDVILRHWREAVPNDRLAHLVKDATRGLVRALTARLAEHQVAFGHWAFLRILWETDGLTQRELSVQAGVMEPTTFSALKAMERLGYVERRQMPPSRKNVYVFLTPAGTPYHDTRGLGGSPIKRAFNSACVRAGLAEIAGYRVDKRGRRWPIIDTTVTPHKLRHTFASWLVMKGVPLRTVAELLGHKSLAMVHRYSHLSPDHLRGSVDLLSTGAKSVQAAGKTS